MKLHGGNSLVETRDFLNLVLHLDFGKLKGLTLEEIANLLYWEYEGIFPSEVVSAAEAAILAFSYSEVAYSDLSPKWP